MHYNIDASEVDYLIKWNFTTSTFAEMICFIELNFVGCFMGPWIVGKRMVYRFRVINR